MNDHDDMGGDAADILPDKGPRPTGFYLVVYSVDEQTLQFVECDGKTALREFIDTLKDPDMVKAIYKASKKLELKKRVVFDI